MALMEIHTGGNWKNQIAECQQLVKCVSSHQQRMTEDENLLINQRKNKMFLLSTHPHAPQNVS